RLRAHPVGHVSRDVRLRTRRGLVRAHPRAEGHRQADPALGPLRRSGGAQPRRSVTLAEAAAQADSLAEQGDERALAEWRAKWDEELEHAARSQDYRERAVAFRAIAQFRFKQKTELLRRGLEDESPACRGSALL